MKESRVVKANSFTVLVPNLRVFPKPLTKQQIDFKNVSHHQPLNGDLFCHRQLGNKTDASVARLFLKYRQRRRDDDRFSRIIEARISVSGMGRLTNNSC